MIDYSKFKPLTEDSDLIHTLLDQTMNSSVNIVELSEEKILHVYDLKDKFFGLRLITTENHDPLSFYPIFDSAKPNKGVLKGISETENIFEGIRSIELLHSYLNTFALDHVFYRILLPQILSTPILMSFSGFVFSQDIQLNPPSFKQTNGSIVKTKGSSIFYNTKGRPIFDYIYQFNVEEVNSIYWNDLIEIIQIKTVLFRQENKKIDLNLYATERVLQNNYYPKIGDDIMGIMQLSSEIYQTGSNN